ncbi:MAG: glucuronate isomerase [Tannerella sp.]|jgi:glucuronate isomerase|nr:glucuronate isomerase [Tannerella sp.]
MKTFLDADFLLQTDTARELYRRHAAKMPIIDYHCHLDPKLIAQNQPFADMTEVWLGSDHYKWRAMRAGGVPEEYITGNKPPYEKFEKWAETLPYTMRNPLYHWTHLELNRIFGIREILKSTNARSVYDACTAKLQTPEFLPQALMKRLRVEAVGTTDDPADPLVYHREIRESGFPVKVVPTWRPDRAMAIENPQAYNDYILRLEEASGLPILTYTDLLDALQRRHDFFAAEGSNLSDHGLTTFYAEPYTDAGIQSVFLKVRGGKAPSAEEANKFRSAMLYELAVMDSKAGWVQQFHVGVIRNNSTRIFNRFGPDAGCDSIGDAAIAVAMNRFFDRLDREGHLAKTIVYNLNPGDNELMVTNLYNFNDGSVPGKMQYGAAWWFLDQLTGIENQLNTLSAMGLLSRFVGMLTDSRSLLSYPRHEYFRRILCNLIGNDIEKGLLPASEITFVGRMVEDICYYNAKRYFNW